MAFIWRGDEDAGDQTVYVAFSMMRAFGQAKKIVWMELSQADQAGGASSKKPLKQGASELPETWDEVQVGSYMRSKIDKLWDQYGFAPLLAQTMLDHPGHRLLFVGICHGGALAQVAAMRYNMSQPKEKARAISWNGYKWTDSAGTELVTRLMGDCLLPIVLSRWEYGRGGQSGQRVWDSVSGGPAHLEPMSQMVLQDVETGKFWSCKPESNCPGRTRISWVSFKRLWRLHFAAAAIAATKASMQDIVDEEKASANTS